MTSLRIERIDGSVYESISEVSVLQDNKSLEFIKNGTKNQKTCTKSSEFLKKAFEINFSKILQKTEDFLCVDGSGYKISLRKGMNSLEYYFSEPLCKKNEPEAEKLFRLIDEVFSVV